MSFFKGFYLEVLPSFFLFFPLFYFLVWFGVCFVLVVWGFFLVFFVVCLFFLLQRVLSFLPQLITDDEVNMNWKRVSLEQDIRHQREMEKPRHLSVP